MPKGGFIAPNDYQNDIETDRQVLKTVTRGFSGALSGFTIAPHGSLLRMVVDPGSAVVSATADEVGTYFAWETAQEEVVFTSPDATNSRIDALILLVGDSQYGSLGTGVVDGPQWFVVDGTPSGSPAAPDDSTIDTAVGAGSWVRWADVQIDVGDTTIQAVNITRYTPDARAPFVVVKASTESVASSTVMQDDDELTFPVGAGTYLIDFYLRVSGSSSGDFNVEIAFPAGTMHEFTTGQSPAVTGTDDTARFVYRGPDVSSPTSSTAFGVVSGETVIRLHCLLIATGAGDVTLRWAQLVSNATPTTVGAGSHVIVERIA